MRFNRSSSMVAPLALAGLGLLATLWNATAADKIQVYRVPKEIAPPLTEAVLPASHPEVGDDHAGHDHAAHGRDDARAMPKVSYTAPAGWREVGAGDMRVAGFSIAGTNGQTAQVAITPLPGMAGRETLIVNMWRQQVGLGELTEADAIKELSAVSIGSEPGKMFDMAGKSATGNVIRIVTAMMHRGENSWFFKLQGDDELVNAQKPNFVAFLKTVKLEEPATTSGSSETAASGESANAPSASNSAGPTWPAPAGWKAVAPGMMQIAKFTVPEVNGAKADVSISVFPSATGGTLSNVNRWRGQIGLAPIEEAGLAQVVKPLDGKNPEAVLIDLNNGNRRLLGAIVPNGEQWYFYKLLGDAAVVEAQKTAFIQFVQEVKY